MREQNEQASDLALRLSECPWCNQTGCGVVCLNASSTEAEYLRQQARGGGGSNWDS
jgi:hypothetical protein